MQDWNDHASWWIEEFTDGADPEYTDQIIPIIRERLMGVSTVLDVGTGEGQVARVLAEIGCEVVGVDPFAAQLETAARRAGGPRYGQAEAAALPFPTAAFDAAVACLVFEHIREVDAAIAEIARVLKPGGEFLLLLNHPLLQTPDSGWIDDQVLDPPEQYWRIGQYLVEAETLEEVHKDVFVRFTHRPLSRYINALVEHGLIVVEMLEPPPPPAFLAKSPSFDLAGTVPRLLVLRCARSAVAH